MSDLVVLAPILGLGAVCVTLLGALAGHRRAERWVVDRLERALGAAEDVDLSKETGEGGSPPAPMGIEALGRSVFTTRPGLWGLLASTGFLAIWAAGWVDPASRLAFLAHLLLSWAGGALLATAVFGLVSSVAAAFRLAALTGMSVRAGVRAMWMVGGGRKRAKLADRLEEAAADAGRIEILDLTGHDLLARGAGDGGGPAARLIARYPDKDVRILLFNPTALAGDQDRKVGAGGEDPLAVAGTTREDHEAKLLATLNRIQQLKRGRPKPIEVRLYSEHPSFRVVVAGDRAFLGPVDRGEGSGEFSLIELEKRAECPSLFGAARAHFLRTWANSVPLRISASTAVNLPGSDGLTDAVIEKAVAEAD